MKIQMRFQKILMLVTLILAALSFVYGLAFLTGGMGNVRYYIPKDGGIYTDTINGLDFFQASQAYVGTVVILSIVFIVLAALLYFTSCHKRRNYYITNYIAIGAAALLALVIAVYSFICISVCMNYFYNGIDWEAVAANIRVNKNYPVGKSPLNFILGYILYFIIIVDVVALILNLVWKIKLMKGEKALLQNGLAKEVA